MSLQLKRAFRRHRQLAVVIILHERAIDGPLVIQPNPDPRAGHDDSKMVPFTERSVGLHQRVFAGRTRAVIPQRARAFVRAEIELRCFRRVPNLHLGTAAQINAAVRQRNSPVIHQ